LDFGKLIDGALMGMLSHQNKNLRILAAQMLRERNTPGLAPKLTRLAENLNDDGALAALWALHGVGGFTDEFALKNLNHRDPFVRAWVVRFLGDAKKVSPEIQKGLVELARYEKEPEVRSQLACSAKRLPAADALPILHEMFQHEEDLKDPHIPLLLWWALENKTISAREQVVQMFNTPDSWKHLLISKEIMHRLAQRYAAEGGPEDLNIVAGILDGAPGKAERDRLLKAVMEAFKGRKIENMPASLKRAIAESGGKNDVVSIGARLKLGAASKDDFAFALKYVANENPKAKAQRIELIQSLGDSGLNESVAPLLEVARSSQWHSVRRAALLALQNFSDLEIGRSILASYDKLPKDQGVRPTALEVLSRRKEWSSELLQAVASKQVPKTEVPFEVVERVKLYKDPQISAAVQKIWGATRQSPKEKQERIATIAKLVSSGQGNAAHGKQLFTATCATCHKLHGEGQSIGPDLTGYERDNLDFLLLAIVDPSAAIREEFTNFELETKDGLLLTGFITERAGQSVTIEDAQQGRSTVPKAKIKSLQASPVSRMPEGLLDSLSEQQIRDLFAYLRSRAPASLQADAKK
jgi:putative heme-binding domain-containing protein